MNTPIADYMSSPLFVERMQQVSGQSSHTYDSILPEDLHLIVHTDYYKPPVDILYADGRHIIE